MNKYRIFGIFRPKTEIMHYWRWIENKNTEKQEKKKFHNLTKYGLPFLCFSAQIFCYFTEYFFIHFDLFNICAYSGDIKEYFFRIVLEYS